jgi:hypothetical protein
MLLEGSYLNDLEKVVETFRIIRRKMIRENEIGVRNKIDHVFQSYNLIANTIY